MIELEQEVYSRIVPTSVRDVGKCYYCGCEAEACFDDFAPPKSSVSFYLNSGENCSFAVIPSCKECHFFLKTCRDGLLEGRKLFVNRCIKKKYRKALNIYERWSEEELENLSRTFSESVKAGIRLGEEAYVRLKFPGYEYEIDGTVFHARRRSVELFTVFGEEFDNYRNALQFAARTYRININVLKEWLIEHGANFDEAINAYFRHIEEEKLRKKKDKLCREFAKTYKQNSNFVKGALDAYMDANPSLSMEECLQLIYKERVKKA
ncbi:hypothetical protein [Microbulbifer sp. YPW1]|uniref:hypothetical protein n=1 Tax=Microbulbifer sp. YPW1 TaxID=2745199 RepID=UPI0015988564|nr:hypothetical protein [Microbulbifer sp. YPW1]QKX16923.1 hypothetical protein HUW35_07860 [Microbulbifer sp. YPW1]